MTIGGIQAFIQYLRSFTQPITQMAHLKSGTAHHGGGRAHFQFP